MLLPQYMSFVLTTIVTLSNVMVWNSIEEIFLEFFLNIDGQTDGLMSVEMHQYAKCHIQPCFLSNHTGYQLHGGKYYPLKSFLFPSLQIIELNLDNTRATQIEGLTDEYTALKTLSLIKIGLTSLKGFPKLPNLTKV